MSIVAIGFFYHNLEFEVYTPKGYNWKPSNGDKHLPTPDNLWILAKMHALACDSNMHELLKHLGMAHLLTETFAIAHHNAYTYERNHVKGSKTIGAFLKPHFVDLIAINTLARETLIAPVNDALGDFFAVPGYIWPKAISEWYSPRDNIWN